MNSVKHGLYAKSVVIPGENPAEYEAHADAYRAEFSPRTVEEEFHVETLIEESWKRRRYSRIEASLSRKIMEQAGASEDPLAVLYSGATPECRMLERVVRARQSCTRAWERANRALQQLIKLRREQQDLRERATAGPARKRPQAPVTEGSQFVANFLQRNVSEPLPRALSQQEREDAGSAPVNCA